MAGQASHVVVAAGPARVSVGSTTDALAEPVSETVVEQELAASGLAANPNRATLTPDGLAIAPLTRRPRSSR